MEIKLTQQFNKIQKEVATLLGKTVLINKQYEENLRKLDEIIAKNKEKVEK